MSHLGWYDTRATDERFVSGIVIEHPDGISLEGAADLRSRVATLVAEHGAKVAAATCGFGQAGPAGERVVRAFWEMDS